MKKIKKIIITIFFLLILLISKEVAADSYIIDETGYDDGSGERGTSYYAPKAFITRRKDVNSGGKEVALKDYTVKVTGEKESSGQYGYMFSDAVYSYMNCKLNIKTGEKLYVGDEIKVRFYIIQPMDEIMFTPIGAKSLYAENKTSYYEEGPEAGVTFMDTIDVKLKEGTAPEEKFIDSYYTDSGADHLRVEVTFSIQKTGQIPPIPIKILYEDEDESKSYGKVTINFYNKDGNIRKHITDADREIDKEVSTNGYKLIDKTKLDLPDYRDSAPSEEVAAFLDVQGVIPKNLYSSDVFKFVDIDKTIDKTSNKEEISNEGVKRCEKSFDNIKINDTNAKEVSAYQPQEDGTFKWVKYKLEKGKKYKFSFDFLSFSNKLDKLYYKLTIDDAGSSENADKVEEEEDELFTDLYNRDQFAKQRREIALALKALGQPRTKHTSFLDVFTNTGDYRPTDDAVSTDVTDKLSTILSIITNIGIVISVLVSGIIGVKYLLGSVEEKAEYKKDMIPYVIGAFLLFGICSIIKILQLFGDSINNI